MGGTDTTDAVLETDRVMMIFSERIQDDPKNWGASFNALYQLAKSQKIPLLLITNRPDLWTLERKRSYPEIILLSCDRTPIRTAARVTPTLFELKRGSIQGKWALSDWSIERSSFNTSR
jgi:hypothetical protein